MSNLLIPAIISVLIISGCVAPVPANVKFPGKFIDYSKVKPENHEALAVRYAESTLRDTLMNPIAMRLDTSETGEMLKLGICQGEEVNNRNRYKIWATIISVNATNTYGEYTGKKPYTLFFNEGEIIASQQADTHNFDDKPIAGGFYFPCDGVK